MRLFDGRDLLVAASLLSRVPVPVDHAFAGARGAAAAWAWPLAGAALGACVGATLAGALALGAAPLFAAALALALGLMLTGALHEDGLGDCADGFGGGADRARRLEIMRDSRLGTFGVAALVLLLIGKAALLAQLGGWQAVGVCAAAGAVSRAPLAALLRWAPQARADGLAAATGRPSFATVVAALGVALALAAALGGAAGALALLAAALTTLATAALARRKIGGISGDVLGAAQALGEAAALAALVAA